jgi:hypothetical protein
MVRRFTLVALAAALTACSEPATAPTLDESQPSLHEEPVSGLIECRRAERDFTLALLGPLGGLLSLDGHQIIVPSGALTSLALVTLRQPVVLDYSRCRRRQIGPGPVTVWEINPVTKAFIREIDGVVDGRATRTVRFDTDPFTGYAVAQ